MKDLFGKLLKTQNSQVTSKSWSLQDNNEIQASIHCDFCGKSQLEVNKIATNDLINICDECTKVCLKLFLTRPDKLVGSESFPLNHVEIDRNPIITRQRRCGFCTTPEQRLAKMIEGQNGYICNMCILLCEDIIEGRIDKVLFEPVTHYKSEQVEASNTESKEDKEDKEAIVKNEFRK